MQPLHDLITQADEATKQKWVARLQWYEKRHPYQKPPDGYWYGWFLKGGRGTGKTRTGAEDVADHVTDYEQWRYAIVTPTFGDARDVCFEGESGLNAVLETRGIRFDYNRSMGELFIPDTGGIVKSYGSERPDRLRGPQHHRAWIDEPASFKDAHLGDALNTTWNNLVLGLRLGDDPRVIITGTPKNVKLIKELVARPDVVVTEGSTHDNAANLAPPMLRQIMRYEGTRIGRQEIAGEILEDVEGAFWQLIWIDNARMRTAPILRRVVVGVDPPGGITEAGIVTAGVVAGECPCGIKPDREHFAVLADDSMRGTPKQWGAEAIYAFDTRQADKIAAEKNFGGDMVESTIRNVRENAPVKMVNASRGKDIRAEPISTLYEEGLVHHIGAFPELEDEMTTWTKDSKESPNRLDALVWALTEVSTEIKRHWSAR